MKEIEYRTGDATNPVGVSGAKLIIHVCNTLGVWGAGFVLSITKKWKEPEIEYRSLYRDYMKRGLDLPLGEIQLIKVEPDITICNMIAQNGIGFNNGKPPLQYDALRECLSKINFYAYDLNLTIVGPRFGTGLAGGRWELIAPIIKEELSEKDIPVIIYDWDKR